VIRSRGEPLAADARRFFEPRFGRDFGDVRIHTDERAASSARALNALAYAVGPNIVFGAGHYDPATGAGRAVIAHELAHVVQQTSASREPGDGRLEVDADDSPAEREAAAAARRVLAGGGRPRLQSAPRAVQRLKEPYIKQVSVNLSPPESASLTWQGAPPSSPGADSFTVSTGKGYSNPEDPRGTCTRDCCSGADVQCAPPYDKPEQVGSCCTPVGRNFWTGKPRPAHNGWLYWTPVEPVHTTLGRGIALHQHDEVTGQAIGHGCIRMDEENAHRIYLYSRGKSTNVTISGSAKVSCPGDRQCASTGALEIPSAPEVFGANLSAPDHELPGGGGAPAPEPAGEAPGDEREAVA
jgi:hypothetical protein